LDWRKVRELPLSAEAVRAQDPRYAEMDKRLFEVFSRAKNMYVEDIMKRLNTPHTPDIQSDEGYHLLHYPEGYYFKEHADDARGMGRVLTCTLNLSDDHEGGRFKFLKGALDLHLRAGEAVLFPASFMFPHEVTKITRGERYSIVTWFK
jgi:predicted 2-oxoglutarate/Fe(II)-dependent dioxygenase YbiX